MERIDLHIHTNVSDGKYPFKEIIDIAAKEFPTYTEDAKDKLIKYKEFVDRIEIIKGESLYE